MRRERLCLAACLIAGLTAASTGAHAAPLPADPARILVTFAAGAQPPGRRVGSSFKGYAGNAYATPATARYLTHRVAADYPLQVVDDWPIDVLGVHCVVYRVVDPSELDRLLGELNDDPRIDSAQRMQYFRLQSSAAAPVTYNDPYHGLQRAWRDTALDRAHRLSTGRDIRIAVIDTAVEQQHTDLKHAVAGIERFVPDERVSQTGDLHGTAVAGVIAAEPNNRTGIVGVAPEARLYSLETCWPDPQRAGAECNSFTLAKALSWAIKQNMQIINLSLAGPEDELLGRLITAALDRGITVVAADSQDTEVRFPASMPGVIAVRSADTAGPGPPGAHEPVFYAPGADVLTTVPDDAYDFISGSSMATAYTTGLVALMRAYAPSLPPERIPSLLLEQFHKTAVGGAPQPAPINACALLAGVRSAPNPALYCPPVLVAR